jgi:hypothetical protein
MRGTIASPKPIGLEGIVAKLRDRQYRFRALAGLDQGQEPGRAGRD